MFHLDIVAIENACLRLWIERIIADAALAAARSLPV